MYGRGSLLTLGKYSNNMENTERDLYEERYFIERYERQRRIRIASTIVPLILGTLGWIAYSIAPQTLDMFGLLNRSFPLIILSFFGMGAAGLLMLYLQTGFSTSKKADLEASYLREQFIELRSRLDAVRIADKPISDLEDKIGHLEKAIGGISVQKAEIGEEQKKSLLAALERSLLADTAIKVLAEIEAKATGALQKRSHIADARQQIKQATGRLEREIIALSRRGNLNLSLGIVTTLIGLASLSYFVLTQNLGQADVVALTGYFVPRVTLVIFIQIFAFFFLKLYKGTLEEIKFFQNEITNIEVQGAALRTILEPEFRDYAPEVLKAMSHVERNYILPKGQTTVELEKAKHEAKQFPQLAKHFVEALRLAKKDV